MLTEHWDTTGKHLRDENVTRWVPYLSHSDKLELLGRIARRMQEGGGGLAGNRLPRQELEAEFAGYLAERLQLPAERAVPAADAMICQLRERNFVLARYGAGLYGFVHRAFLEYLAAEDIHSRFADRVMSEAELFQAFRSHWPDPAWEEVLVLLAGMLHEKFTAQAIDWLLTADPLWFLHDEGVPRHVVLAIRCLGEVRRPGAVTAQSLAVANALTGLLEVPQHHLSDAAISALEKTTLPVLARLGADWAGQRHYQHWYRTRGARLARSLIQPAGVLRRMHLALLGRDDQPREDPAERARLRRRVARRLTSRSNPGAGLLGQVRNIATDRHDDPETKTWLLGCLATRDAHARAEALQALAEGWSSPGTTRLLSSFAESDPAPEVREAAIKSLTVVPDGLTGRLEWLRARAVVDEHEDVRTAAVTVIAGSPQEPDQVEWLCERAVADEHKHVRAAALTALADRSHDDPRVLSWLRGRAASDQDGHVRASALHALANGHTGGELCDWLQDRAVSDPDGYARRMSAEALAEGWWQVPGIAQWFRERVQADPDRRFRAKGLRMLAGRWPDDETEALLRERATADQDEFARLSAVEALAEGWWQAPGMPGWLRERIGADSGGFFRLAALRILAACWPGDKSAGLLREHAVTDPDKHVRAGALQLLATSRPDDQTRTVLSDRAAADEDWYVRTTALELLAAGWDDTLPWFIERAGEDPESEFRRSALRIVTGWHDQPATALALRERAILDEDIHVRAQALDALAAGWHEDGIVALIRDRATADQDPYVRGRAIETLAAACPDDPGNAAWICDRADADTDPRVRRQAVAVLDANWASDPGVACWLRKHALSDKHWCVRAAAVSALCAEGDVALARDRAVADRHVTVRIEAVNALGNTPQDPATAALLREIAVADRHPRARGEALEALARQADDDIRVFIKQRAHLDPDSVVRLRAALARAVKDHPDRWLLLDFDPDSYLRYPQLRIENSRLDHEARTMLHEHAVTDPDERVRAAALRVLADKMQQDDRWGRRHDDDIEALLRDRAASDGHPDVQAAAAEALAGADDPDWDDTDGDDPES